jgi:hypothetical protein
MAHMAMPWSRLECEATVADYVEMLKAELEHRPYNKTAHRRLLVEQLQHRSDTAIERKHQNISAILIEFGYPYINGYKPLGNYQGLLAQVVEERVEVDAMLAAVVQQAVEAPAAMPPADDILSRQDEAPHSEEFVYPLIKQIKIDAPRPRVNYLEREARNVSLGRAGEEFALRFERERLTRIGRGDLMERLEHTAVERGDGAGFDIHSYERDGTDRFIEVKTTAYGKQTPFFVTRNEVAVSRYARDRYHVYRLFRFRDDPRLYSVHGALTQICSLQPVQYAARPR